MNGRGGDTRMRAAKNGWDENTWMRTAKNGRGGVQRGSE